MGIKGPVLIEPRFATLRTGFARPRPSWWLLFLSVGLGLALIGGIVADEKALLPLLNVMGMAGSIAILAGVRMHHPARRCRGS